MAKLYDKLMNRVIKGKLTIESGDDVDELVPVNLKSGSYIHDGVETFKWVEEIPTDFTGISLTFADDGIYFEYFDNGVSIESTLISSSGIGFSTSDGNASYDVSGASKLNFVSLTHSLAELDSTLRQLVEDAVSDGWVNGVSCTQEQWNTIKALLDKSLYFNYMGTSMIKSFTDGIMEYGFGATNSESGYTLVFNYNDNLLYAKYGEI